MNERKRIYLPTRDTFTFGTAVLICLFGGLKFGAGEIYFWFKPGSHKS